MNNWDSSLIPGERPTEWHARHKIAASTLCLFIRGVGVWEQCRPPALVPPSQAPRTSVWAQPQPAQTRWLPDTSLHQALSRLYGLSITETGGTSILLEGIASTFWQGDSSRHFKDVLQTQTAEARVREEGGGGEGAGTGIMLGIRELYVRSYQTSV